MSDYLVRRTVATLVSLVGVTLLVTLFLHLIPGDPIEVMLGEQAADVDREALRAAIGLDRPVHEQYLTFIADMLGGELRTSLPPFQDRVMPSIAWHLPRTMVLAVASMLFAIAIGVPLGVVSARRPGSATDRAAMFFSLLGVSLPRTWLGPVLILVFAIRLDWLPPFGIVGPHSLILPAVTLGLAMTAMLARMTRASMLDVAREDFVTTARAKGLAEAIVARRHVLRNALVPVVTIIGLQFGAVLTGTIVTEKVFDWPGLGSLLLEAISKRDYNTVRATVLVFAVLYGLVNLLTDLAYGLVDPRIRLDRESGT